MSNDMRCKNCGEHHQSYGDPCSGRLQQVHAATDKALLLDIIQRLIRIEARLVIEAEARIRNGMDTK